MSLWKSVPATDQQQTRSNALRIAGISGYGLRSSVQPLQQNSPHILRSSFGHLRSAWRWLERKRAQQVSTRRLRVAETISLGEKRFVSIVQVDGAQFLIGGSSSSVQLLAVLDKLDSQQSIAQQEPKIQTQEVQPVQQEEPQHEQQTQQKDKPKTKSQKAPIARRSTKGKTS